MITKRTCPVCKEEKAEKCFSISFGQNEYLPSDYTVVSCTRCGFCFSDSSATMQDYDDYYVNCNVYSEEQKQMKWVDILHEETKKLLLRYVSLDARIMDMGFGKGELLRFLKEAGFQNLHGIDPSVDSVNHLKKYGINGQVGGCYDGGREEFDVVMLFNVLEHLFEPRLAIEMLERRLVKNGFLLLGVPIYDRLEKDNTPLPNNFNREHINYFSEKTIRRLAAYYGLCEVEALYVEIQLGKQGENQFYLGVFRKEKQSVDAGVFESTDSHTKTSVLEYYNRRIVTERRREERIEQLLKQKKEIVVWGAGENLSNLLATTNLQKCKIRFIVDNNKTKVGKVIEGYTVNSPECLYEFDGTVVICSMLAAEAIQKQMREMGLTQEIVILD